VLAEIKQLTNRLFVRVFRFQFSGGGLLGVWSTDTELHAHKRVKHK